MIEDCCKVCLNFDSDVPNSTISYSILDGKLIPCKSGCCLINDAEVDENHVCDWFDRE